MQVARVLMLDGVYKDFQLNRNSEGEALFRMICHELSLDENSYFAICFYDGRNYRHWLHNDKKILRQLKGLPWEFAFEVKFFPTSIASIDDKNAEYYVYLQLKSNILSERLPATLPTQAILGSLIAQAEFGNADCSAEYEQYLRSAQIAPNMNDQLMDQIKELHKGHKGKTPSESQCSYIDSCKHLSKYGVFLYNAKDEHNQPIELGICASGINVYQGAVRVHRFIWQTINKISFRKNMFSVKLIAGEMNKKEVTMVFKVEDHTEAKRVWRCGVEHHTFYRLIQSDEKQKVGLFRWGSLKFRFHGRQSKNASQLFDTSAASTLKRQSSRVSQSCENVLEASTAECHTNDKSYEVISSSEKIVANAEEQACEEALNSVLESIYPHGEHSEEASSSHVEEKVEIISSKTTVVGNRKIETIAYARKKNGVVDTFYEHRVIINTDLEIDHDAELTEAILEATKMNPDTLVESIEVRQEISI